jgi:hypothetical protein
MKFEAEREKNQNQKGISSKDKNLKENHQKLTSLVSASFQDFKKYCYCNFTAITILSQSA